MPTGQEYTVRDTQTGKVVTFRWNGMTPPAESDLESVFAEARGQSSKASTAAPDTSMLDTLIGLLPAAGGTLGGIVGGIGGTVAGMGIGGVPGAVGGATLGGAAGEAAKQLANRARGKPSPETSMQALAELGKEGAIQGGSELIGAGIAKGVSSGAKAVYRGYLKPSLAAKNVGKANQIVETALKEAIPITRAGATIDEAGKITGKAGRLISELRAEVDAEVASASGTIDLKRIADRVRRFAKAKYFKPGADQADYKAALDVADRLDAHPALKLPAGQTPARIPVSVSKANETKRTLQDAARNSYGTPNANAKKIAEKAGARKLRIAVEGATGGRSGAVAQLNAREAKLISAAKAIAQAVAREGNNDRLVGVKTLAAGAVGGSYGYEQGGTPGAIAGTLASRAALTPAVATRAAIVAHRIAKQLGVSAASAARLAAVALESEQEPDRASE